MTDPSVEEWGTLYQAAKEFQEIAPWKWMDNIDMFAVENPRGGELGYCSVLGGGGQEFGLAVFVGAEGLQDYLDIVSGETDSERLESGFAPRSVSVMFGGREFMRPRNLQVVRSLGLRLRGRMAWPLFQSFHPGYAPWYLDRDEALFLTDALRQAMIVSQQVRDEGLDLLSRMESLHVLTRRLSRGAWRGEWRRLKVPPKAVTLTPDLPDAARLQHLRDTAVRHTGAWEFGVFPMAALVDSEPGRPPFFPTCLLMADQRGFVLGVQLLGPRPSPNEVQEATIQMLEKAGGLPRTLVVPTEATSQLVGAAVRGLGVSLRIGPVKAVEEARAALEEQFGA